MLFAPIRLPLAAALGVSMSTAYLGWFVFVSGLLRMRSGVANSRFALKSAAAVTRITVSLGLATAVMGQTAEELIQAPTWRSTAPKIDATRWSGENKRASCATIISTNRWEDLA